MKVIRSIRLGLLAALVALMALPATARTYTSETLHFQIVYHWGVIWKHAGDARLSIKRTPQGYYAQLVGRTRSWADTFYPVRDTLKCTMNSQFLPIRYEKCTHEKNYRARDLVQFSRSNGTTTARCTRWRKSGIKHANLANRGNAYDMLSVFYMLRNLDFGNLAHNKSYVTCIFSGKTKEVLTIKYRGMQAITLRDKSRHQAYHITFKFTQDGKRKSSDDLDAWLSTAPDRRPLMVVGKLPFGEVKCYLSTAGK